MEAVLPPFFIALASVCLVLVLLALRRSLAVVLSRPGHSAVVGTGADRDMLLAEKRAMLQTLRDLKFEHETGKISDADFERLDQRYRARAKQVLRALDADVSAYRDEARKLIEAQLGGAAAPREATEAAAVEAAATEAVASTKRCEACGADNDPDAVFCKKCGKRFDAADADGTAATAEASAAGEGRAEAPAADAGAETDGGKP